MNSTAQLKQIQTQLDELTKQFTKFVQGQTFTPIKEYTFFEWLDEWYKVYKLPNLTKNALVNIDNAIRNHIKPFIQDKPLMQISALDLQNLLNQTKRTYIRKFTFNCLNNCFAKAYKLKLIKDNPMLSVDKVKHTYKQVQALTPEQQKTLLEIIQGTTYENLLKFYLLSGCRRTEALTLKWQDIDFKAKTIFINGTKTQTSKRKIPLFDELNTLLINIPKTSESVFNCTLNALKCYIRRLKPKIPFNFHLHMLRHTFATRCVESGISLKTIQKWLGHSKLDMTANIYSHILPTFENEEIKKFNSQIPK